MEFLNDAFPSAAAEQTAGYALEYSSASSCFDHLAKFIDSFCASGSKVSYKVEGPILNQVGSGGLSVLQIKTVDRMNMALDRKNITTDKYNPATRQWTSTPMNFVMHQSKTWLYVHQESMRYEGIQKGFQCDSEIRTQVHRCLDRLKDSIEFPDYFVLPDADIQRGFFLPVNKFSLGFNFGQSMLDADRLELLRHGDWFTVFRYTPHASSEDSIIIKRTPINNSTLKYLLHERTMLRFLNGSERIAGERLDGGFAPLLVWNVNGKNYKNERFMAYQDGGRPLEVQFFSKGAPSPPPRVILRIAQELVQALIFLIDKRVVHRSLNLGTVVFSEPGGVKLIALGSAKYIDRLPYEDRIRHFEVNICGVTSPQQHDRTVAFNVFGSPRPPTTAAKQQDFVHPQAKCVISVCI